jgi:hypothetical protein
MFRPRAQRPSTSLSNFRNRSLPLLFVEVISILEDNLRFGYGSPEFSAVGFDGQQLAFLAFATWLHC